MPGTLMPYNEALDKRKTLAMRIGEMVDEFEANNCEWKDATTEANWRQLNADYNEANKAFEQHEANRKIVARKAEVMMTNDPVGVQMLTGGGPSGALRGFEPEQVKELAFEAWIQHQSGESLTPQQSEASQELGLNLNAKQLVIPLMDTRRHRSLQRQWRSNPHGVDAIYNAPLETTTAGLGGNIVPPETMLRRIEVNMLAYGGILGAAETITTATGEPMSWPTANDTGNKGRIIAQNAPHDDTAGGGNSGDGGPNPAFGKVTWGSFDYTSDTILVPYRLLRDSVGMLAEVLGDMIGERIGRILGEHCTTGVGTTEPEGIVTASTLGVTCTSATSIDPDEVYELQHSVDPAYRNGASFMCSDEVVLHLRLKKDTQDRYLWQSGFNTGVPDTLAGSPLVYNHEMSATITTDDIVMLYGQLSKYKVRRVGSIRFYRLTERYREKDQDGFVAMMSADGGLLDAGTAPVKHMQMA